MQASPDDVGNILLGAGTLLVLAEVISASVVGPIVLIGKAISNMTSGKKHKSKLQGTYGTDIDTEDSTSSNSDDSGSEV